MKIENGKMVSVTYELKYDDADAKLIEVCDKSRPLTFLFGAGMMLPHFEKNLDGLENGPDDYCANAHAVARIGDETLEYEATVAQPRSTSSSR